MTQLPDGPTNLTQGNSAFFTVKFTDANGNITTPLSAILSVSYTNINLLPQTDNITLLPNNAFLTGTWSSTNAASGLAPWTITATGASSVSQTGTIRVLDEFGVLNSGLLLAVGSPGITIPAPFVINAGGTYNYSATFNGDFLVNTNAAVTINLPDSRLRQSGVPVRVSDVNGMPNVTIFPFPAQLIQGMPNVPLNSAYGSFTWFPEPAPLTGWYAP
jgi:hypothetical protein